MNETFHIFFTYPLMACTIGVLLVYIGLHPMAAAATVGIPYVFVLIDWANS